MHSTLEAALAALRKHPKELGALAGDPVAVIRLVEKQGQPPPPGRLHLKRSIVLLGVI